MKNVLLQIKKIENEQKRRYENNALKRYNTGEVVHEKQLEFHKCQKRNRWVLGGNRTGKTECGAVEALWILRGEHPYRKNKKNTIGWVVSLSREVQREVAQAKILNYINPDWIVDIVMQSGKKENPSGGVIDFITIKNVFGGISKLCFKSCDQGREKFQGASLDFVWFDEEPPEDIYFECKMRVLDRCGDIFGTMTPLKGLTWVYETIYLNSQNDSEIWYITMSWKDNPFLNKKEVESFKDSLSEEELRSRCYGEFMSNNGRVYTEFDENVHIIEPFNVPKEWYDKIAIDPGLKNPLSAHWYAVDFDNNVYVIAEHYEAERDIIYHSNKIKEICDRLNWPRKNNYIEALIDSAGLQKTLASNKSVVDLFYDYGILTNPKVNKDLFSGISRVKAFLKNADGKAKLFIFKNCTNLIRELKSYRWGESDNPIKNDDHCLDELRYYIMSKPEPNNLKQEKSEIQKDKERLYRRLRRS